MKSFGDALTFTRNARGCYILDPIKGCNGVNAARPNGCYGDCYAKRIADRYRINFAPKMRMIQPEKNYHLFGVTSNDHRAAIAHEVSKIESPFFRMGDMGDTSMDWVHTLSIAQDFKYLGKKIVIITKHLKTIPDGLLRFMDGLYINTSISALDTKEEITHRLQQYERLKGCCVSILRVVTCDFVSHARREIQSELLRKEKVIDTVFRPSKSNPLIVNKEIRVKHIKFLCSKQLASVHNYSTFLGYCQDCPDQCGINL